MGVPRVVGVKPQLMFPMASVPGDTIFAPNAFGGVALSEATRMTRRFLCAVFAMLAGSLQGCMLNNVSALRSLDPLKPSSGRAIAVFGLGVEAPRDFSFAVTLDEYDPGQKAITGGCWRYNRMRAILPTATKRFERFAFDVRPGSYIYSGFNGSRKLSGGPVVFDVPPGAVVFLGDFVLITDDAVELRTTQSGPEGTTLAVAKPASPPNIFICTP